MHLDAYYSLVFISPILVLLYHITMTSTLCKVFIGSYFDCIFFLQEKKPLFARNYKPGSYPSDCRYIPCRLGQY